MREVEARVQEEILGDKRSMAQGVTGGMLTLIKHHLCAKCFPVSLS